MMAETTNPEAGKQDNLAWVKVNGAYFKSLPGIIKIAELAIGIVCMACASPAFVPESHWFLFVTVISFIITLIWVFVYLLSIRDAITFPINWVLTEAVNTGVLTVLYAIAFIIQLTFWSGAHYFFRGSNIAAGVFGLFNTLVYAAGTYLLYAEWRASSSDT